MKTWFITGASSGLGRALAEAALARGDVVVGTVRREEDRQAFEALAPEGRGRCYLLDVADDAQTSAVIAAAERETGGIDILVNNAGYGLLGAVEEVSLAELRALFAVNFFGAVACIQAVLPFMRARRAGHIINITSVSGLAPWGGTAAYGASKYALEGLGQSLAQEVAELGIKVTNVEPGSLRTDFGRRSLAYAEREIADYAGAGHLPKRIFRAHDPAAGADPALAAQAILAIVGADAPPLHLLLGEDAMHYAGDKLASMQAEFAKWKHVTMSITPDPEKEPAR